MALVQGVLLIAAIVAIIATASLDSWDPLRFGIIVAFTVATAIRSIRDRSRVQINGSSAGCHARRRAARRWSRGDLGVIAMVSTGPALDDRWRSLRNNLVAYAWFPLIVGLAFYVAVHHTVVVDRGEAMKDSAGYYLLVFGAFVLALALNSLMVVGFRCWRVGDSLTIRMPQDALMPMLARSCSPRS